LDVAGTLHLQNGTSINEFSNDTLLAGNSDDAVPTEKAVKTYVSNSVGSFRSDEIRDADNDTKIQVEKGTDDDMIRFYVGGTERWVMDGSRLEPRNTGHSVFIGDSAGYNDDLTNRENIFIGYRAGYSNTEGYNNTAMGNGALYSNTTGIWNVGIGHQSLYSNTWAPGNIAIGYQALYSNTEGNDNTANGNMALYSNTTGFCNTANGSGALSENTTGLYNTANGFHALARNTTGNFNTGLGDRAGYYNQTGSFNVFLGNQAGYYETGSNKLYIENSDKLTPLIYGEFDTDKVKINGSLSLTEGISDWDSDTKIQVEKTSDDDKIRFDVRGSEAMLIDTNGNIGIGTSTPGEKLHIQGNIKMVDGNQEAGKILTSDAEGTGTWQNLSPQAVFGNEVLPPDFSCLNISSSLAIGLHPRWGAISGNYFYVLNHGGNGMKVIDVSDPANPSLSGSLAFGGAPTFITVSGNFAYVVDMGDCDLKVIDVSDPGSPSLSGSLAIGCYPVSVSVSGNYAYVVDYGDDDLKVIDVSDPENPSLSGNLPIGLHPVSIAVSGNYAYVADYEEGDLKVIDVSDPENPSLSGSIAIGSSTGSVKVSGNYAYLLDLGAADLVVIDVSDPANPNLSGSLAIGSSPYCVAVLGNYACVVNPGDDDLKVVDVSNPASPSLSASLPIGLSPFYVAVSGNYAYVVDNGSNDLKVIQLSCNTTITINPTSGTFTEVPLNWQKSGNDIYNANIGKVGIGTSAPTDAMLHIEGHGTYDGILRINNSGSNGASFFMGSTRDGWDAGANKFIMGHGAPSSANVDLTINSSGDVGIGTPSPASTLDVAGSFRVENGTSINEISTDILLAGNSDDAIPTEKAVKSYVDEVKSYVDEKTYAINDLEDCKTNWSSTFLGYGSGANSSLAASHNVAVGIEALHDNTLGSYNTAIGYQALNKTTDGMGNIAIGTWAGYNNVSGHYNIFIGNSGLTEDGDSKLYIGNNPTPLIYGDFSNPSLQVNGELAVKKNSTGFIALFENTNTGDGDGIKIKLGKASANNGLPAMSYDLGITEQQKTDLKNLIDCNYSGNKLNLLTNIVQEGIVLDAKTIGGLAVGVGNLVTGFINSKLGLPVNLKNVQMLGKFTVFPGFNWWRVHIDSYSAGPYNFPNVTLVPKIPEINLSALGIDEIEIMNLGFWGIPNICMNDVVSNPLSKENEFIQFSDYDDVRMGSIKAQSVEDWALSTLTPAFFFGLRGALASTLDKLHAQHHFRGKISEAIATYPNIGVEYSSGNGDYAEWLERLDFEEAIGAGDIVAVKGGKITKDLCHAEQIMAVSHHPIVLGNIPPEGESHLGNNIAFMGQVPVKIMGIVNSGDYIVGNSDIPGYGIAVAPENMTVDDLKLTVGRAWESNQDNGPKLVNTVIGVHNGDYLNILKRYEQKFKESETRLESVEAKIDRLTELLSQ